MRLNPVTRNRTQIQKPSSLAHLILVILILPAVVIVSAPLDTATLLWNANNHKESAYSLKAFSDINNQLQCCGLPQNTHMRPCMLRFFVGPRLTLGRDLRF